MFESVDLPAPFSPSSACTSPADASKWTSSLATTPGNRLVIPRSSTAGMKKGRARRAALPAPVTCVLALRAPDDALDEVVHRVEVVERRPLPRLDAELAALVVDRPLELVPLAADDERLLLRDQLLRLGRDLRPVRREEREAILHVAVVVAGLPGPVHRGFDALGVVRAPVVDRAGQPRLRRELLRVRVVPDPRHTVLLGVLAGRGAVDVLPDHVRACRMAVLGRLRL